MFPRLGHTFRPKITLIALTAVGAAIALAACGGSSDDQASAQQSFQDAALKFAQCMRDNGVDVPDPQPGQGGIQIQAGQNGIDPNSETFRKAQSECQHFMRDAIPEDQRPDPTEMRDQLTKLAQCMREHGVDMPDPQVNSDGTVEFGSPPGSSSGGNMPDPNDPDFENARRACEQETGVGGPGGKGPIFGTGGPQTSGPNSGK
jgi:hypothetical protein